MTRRLPLYLAAALYVVAIVLLATREPVCSCDKWDPADCAVHGAVEE